MYRFRKIAKIALVLVYLVIVAGAVVRMTGSGMGCPDWPKCFGYYIPPTERAELEWHPSREYKKGQVIILNESLWVANSDFLSATQYNPQNWEQYTRHDYATFNAFHTWTEFINRLFGIRYLLIVRRYLFSILNNIGYKTLSKTFFFGFIWNS